MATTEEIVNVLSSHVNDEHFVVDVKAAIKQLRDPRSDFETLLSDPTVPQWHFYALEGLRSIAGDARERPLSPEDGQVIIESTKGVAQQLGTDEFYKTFDALARSPHNVRFLADFVQDLLHSRDQRDWLWLAFSAMATLLDSQPNIVTHRLAQDLVAAYQEHTAMRRPQMGEVIRKLGLPPTGGI